jgi:hypothetical protein
MQTTAQHTDVPGIVIPPSPIEDRLVGLPIRRILPSLHTPAIHMSTQRKLAVSWPTDPKAVAISEWGGKGNRSIRGGVLVEERKEESLDVERRLAGSGFELRFRPAENRDLGKG